MLHRVHQAAEGASTTFFAVHSSVVGPQRWWSATAAAAFWGGPVAAGHKLGDGN
jgi:hypothetical protein